MLAPANLYPARGGGMAEQRAVARITEISARSNESFEDAIQVGIERATRTLRNVTSAWIKDLQVFVQEQRVTTYEVVMHVTFELEE